MLWWWVLLLCGLLPSVFSVCYFFLWVAFLFFSHARLALSVSLHLSQLISKVLSRIRHTEWWWRRVLKQTKRKQQCICRYKATSWRCNRRQFCLISTKGVLNPTRAWTTFCGLNGSYPSHSWLFFSPALIPLSTVSREEWVIPFLPCHTLFSSYSHQVLKFDFFHARDSSFVLSKPLLYFSFASYLFTHSFWPSLSPPFFFVSCNYFCSHSLTQSVYICHCFLLH